MTDSIGGALIRLWGYGTRDSRATVTASGYVTGAAEIGLRVGDLVLVVEWDADNVQQSAYTTRVASIVNDAATLVYDDNYLQEFSTLANFRAANIGGSIETVRVNGALTAGDSPPMTLVRKSSEPTHQGKFQSADGAWWEFARGMPIDLLWFEPTIDDSYSAGDVTLAENWAANQALYNSDDITIEEWLTGNTIAVKYWLETAALYGVKATAAPGLIRVFGTIVEPGNYNLNVECSAGLRFRSVPVSAAGLTRPMINIDSNVSAALDRPNFEWRGGRFLADGLPYGNPAGTAWNQGSGGARGGCLGFTRYRRGYLAHAHFKGGTSYFDANGTYATPGYVAGDQGVTFIQCKHITMFDCHGDGLPDTLVYPRTNANMNSPGEDSLVGVIEILSCSAKNCHKGVYGKYSGGRVIVRDFDAQDCWAAVQALGDYNPAEGEGGTEYQPYDCIISGVRAERIASRVVEVERAQVAAVSDVIVSDWGRRFDGEASVTSGRSYVPIVMLTGCQNVGVSNIQGRLRSWNGGNSTLHTAPFLEGVLVEAHTAGSGSNTLASKTIKLANISIEGIPIEVTDGIASEVSSSSLRGTGALVRVRGADEGVISIDGWLAPNVSASSQTFIFNSTNAQFIDGVLVPSPDGAGWTPGAEFLLTTTIASGVITIPTRRRVTCLTVSIATQGGASSDDLDTISGSFPGQQLTLRRETGGQSVVLKNGTGNLSIGADITIANVDHFVVLSRRGNTWYLVYKNF